MTAMRISAAAVTLYPAALCLQAQSAFAFPGGGVDDDTETIVILYMLLFVLFMLPTIVAFARGHPNRWPIAIINVLFGGTGLGWLGSLVWAFQAVHRSPTGNHGGESGLNLFANDVQTVRLQPPQPITVSTTDIDELSARLLRLRALQANGALSTAEYDALKREAIYGR